MQTIFGIQPPQMVSMDEIYYIPTVIFVVVIFCIYIYGSFKKYYLMRVRIREDIQQLCNKLEHVSKQEFYEWVNNLYKQYFEYKGISNIQSCTYKEIYEYKNKVPKKVFQSFFLSYQAEYDQGNDDYQIRRQALKSLSKII